MLLSLILVGLVGVQTPDSTAVQQSGERNVMLNAEASNKPREINIGLSPGDMGTVVVEDGMLMNYVDYPIYQFHHWAGGHSYSSRSIKPLEDGAIYLGRIGAMLDSYSKLGGDRFEGSITAASSSFGRIKADLALSGPLGKGFYYMVSAYVNKDPGSTRPVQLKYVNDMEVFRGALTKRWSGGELSLLYKVSFNRDVSSKLLAAPFYYVGDGSVRSYDGFRMGLDNYFPTDDLVSFVDGYTGKPFKAHVLGELGDKVIHDVSTLLRIDDVAGWKLQAGLHLCLAPDFHFFGWSVGNISQITGGMSSSGKAVTLADGTAYSGPMQGRNVNFQKDALYDVIGNATLSRTLGAHDLTLGLYNFFDKQFVYTSYASFAHTVEVNPVRLYLDGKDSWNLNKGMVYADGWSNDLCVFAMDKWAVNSRLSLQTGLRAGWLHVDTWSAYNLSGQTANTRTDGFFIKNGTAHPNHIRTDGPNFAALLKGDYKIGDCLYGMAEYIYTQRHRIMIHHFSSNAPNPKPAVGQLGRVGLVWNNDWLDLSSAVSYIHSAHGNSSTTLSRLVGGVSESVIYLADVSYGTFGWTNEATLHKGGFNLHALLTLQEPKYTNLIAHGDFSDGPFTMDYTGYYYSGLSRVLAEIDPSYSWKKFRVWGSLRYFSKQYANKTNTVAFDGHWETFAGVSYKLLPGCNVAVDMVNLLGAKGAKGKIDAADTLGADIDLTDYLLAGTYIIPFTVNFSVSYSF